MNDNCSPCIEFQGNRWAPYICITCFLHLDRHQNNNNNTIKKESTPLLSSSSPIISTKLYESVDSLKTSNINKSAAQLQLLSPTLLSLTSTSEQPPLTFSFEKDKPIEKSLPLYFKKENTSNSKYINKQPIENIPAKMNLVKQPVCHIKTTLTPVSKVVSTPTTPKSNSGGIVKKLDFSLPTTPTTTTPTKPDNSSSSTITTSTSKSNIGLCKEFLMHQWRPNICLFCFLPKSLHTTTTTTTTTTTSLSSDQQSTTISTTTTTITTKSPNTTTKPIPLLLKSKSLPPKLLPKLSQASLDISNQNIIYPPSYRLSLTPPINLQTLKPILISKSNEPILNINNNNNNNSNNNTINTTTTTSTTELKSESNDNTKRFSITISTSTSKTSILSPPTFSETLNTPEVTLIENETKPTSKRNSGVIQPLRLKSFSFSANSTQSSFDDDPFKDFEDLVDDDDFTIDTNKLDKNETCLTITTPSQTTMVSSTTTILQSPRVIEKTTTTTSSIIPLDPNVNTGTNSSSNNTTTTTTKRRSIKMDQFKEKEDDWDVGMDLSSFLKKQRKKANSKKSSKNSGGPGYDIFSDFSYCSNKFMEISSVKEEAQRQSVDFGGLHPNAFEAFQGILEAKQKQISKAFERNKIDQSDCEKLVDELNSVKDLLCTLMDGFNKNPPVISLQNTKDIHKDIQDLNNTTSNSNNNTNNQSICITSDFNNFD